MNMNNFNLLEFGNEGNITFTAICDFEINGHEYKEGDVVLELKNVPISFKNRNIEVDRQAVDRKLAFNNSYLDSVSIGYLPLNKDVIKLFFINVQDSVDNVFVKKEKTMAMQGSLLLTTDMIIDNVKIIDFKAPFSIQQKNGYVKIDSKDFVNEQYYDVQYDYKINGTIIDFSKVNDDIPYLKAQIAISGNKDKKNDSFYLIIQKTKLIYYPVLNFQNGGISYGALELKIIDNITNDLKLVIPDGEN